MKNKNILLGAHISIAGGLSKAFFRAQKLNIKTMQIFTKSNRQWAAKPLTNSEIESFKHAQATTNIKPVITHASYLINIGSPDKALRQKSFKALKIEFQRCSQLGIPYLVLHPGSHGEQSIEECQAAIAQELNKLFEQVPGNSMILLENTAGQGKNIGHSFEQLKAIINNVIKKDRIGVCFDTCHAYAAGYNFSIEREYKKMWKSFDAILGLEKLKAIHLNDSKKELGSRVDRHEHIGKGKIGKEGFALLINDKRLANIPKILETPKEGGPDENEDYSQNIQTLLGLVE